MTVLQQLCQFAICISRMAGVMATEHAVKRVSWASSRNKTSRVGGGIPFPSAKAGVKCFWGPVGRVSFPGTSSLREVEPGTQQSNHLGKSVHCSSASLDTKPQGQKKKTTKPELERWERWCARWLDHTSRFCSQRSFFSQLLEMAKSRILKHSQSWRHPVTAKVTLQSFIRAHVNGVNREVQTVHWEAGKEGGCRDRCQERQEKRRIDSCQLESHSLVEALRFAHGGSMSNISGKNILVNILLDKALASSSIFGGEDHVSGNHEERALLENILCIKQFQAHWDEANLPQLWGRLRPMLSPGVFFFHFSGPEKLVLGS